MPVASARRGFTLIELLVAISIAALLLLLATPAYIQWMADSQVTGAATALADGLRFAQGEAIKRNANIEFVIAPGAGWTVQPPGGSAVRSAEFKEGARDSTITRTPATSTTVTFNALGLVETANAAAPTVPFTRVDVTHANGTRQLRVVVGGPNARAQIKVCNPDTSKFVWPTDPLACPPT